MSDENEIIFFGDDNTDFNCGIDAKDTLSLCAGGVEISRILSVTARDIESIKQAFECLESEYWLDEYDHGLLKRLGITI